jgi:hypothetical protein
LLIDLWWVARRHEVKNLKIKIPCKENIEVNVYQILKTKDRKGKDKLIKIEPMEENEKEKIYALIPGNTYKVEMRINNKKHKRKGIRIIRIENVVKPEITDDGWQGDFNPNFEVLQ